VFFLRIDVRKHTLLITGRLGASCFLTTCGINETTKIENFWASSHQRKCTMKLPKKTKRYCPKCKKHTDHTVSTAKQKSRSATHPLSRGSLSRQKARGLRRGFGNKGRFSKKAPKSWKRKTKVTRRIVLLYKCKDCGKSSGIKKAIRSGRIEIGEKVAK